MRIFILTTIALIFFNINLEADNIQKTLDNNIIKYTCKTDNYEFEIKGDLFRVIEGENIINETKIDEIEVSEYVYFNIYKGETKESKNIIKSLSFRKDGQNYTISNKNGNLKSNFPYVNRILKEKIKSNQTHSVSSFKLDYSTYLGGNGLDCIRSIYLNDDGSYIVSGFYGSGEINIMGDYYSTGYKGTIDVIVAEFSEDHELNWLTLLGGSRDEASLEVLGDFEGYTYIGGDFRSRDFPTTSGALINDGPNGTADGALIILNPEGQLKYSSFIGGGAYDATLGFARDGKFLWGCGQTRSPDLPVTANAIQPNKERFYDAFYFKFNLETLQFEYISYYGGDFDEIFEDLYLDNDGNPVVAGWSMSTNLDYGSQVAEFNYNFGDRDGIVGKIDKNTHEIIWLSNLGGTSNDRFYNVTVDNNNNIIATGITRSSDFFIKDGFQPLKDGDYDYCIASFSNEGKLNWSSFYGTEWDDGFIGEASYFGGVDVTDNDLISFSGITRGKEIPIGENNNLLKNDDADPNGDAFINLISLDGRLLYSSRWGGNYQDAAYDVRSKGDKLFIVGLTESTDFPITENAFQDNPSNDIDGFISCFKFSSQAACEHDYFNYPNFTDPDNLNLAGEASLSDGSAFLTDNRQNISGGIWRSNTVSVRDGFETSFAFRFTEGYNDFKFEGSLPGADGIAFVVQNAGPEVLGFDGGGIGYKRVPNSLAVELDLYRNDNPGAGHTDPNGNHIAIQSNGRAPNTTDHSGDANYGMIEDIPTIQVDGTIYYMKIDYNIIPGKLRVWLSEEDDFEGLEPVLISDDIELEDMLFLDTYHRAFVGLTSSTGSSFENHEILNWEFCSVTPAVDYTFVESDIEKRNDIYPNPAKDIAYINLENDLLNYEHIELLNSGGVSLGSGLINNQGNKLEIDLSGVAKGVYYLKLKTNGRIYVYKVVKT